MNTHTPQNEEIIALIEKNIDAITALKNNIRVELNEKTVKADGAKNSARGRSALLEGRFVVSRHRDILCLPPSSAA